MKATTVLKSALLIEAVVLVCVVFYSDSGCKGDCFEGVNNAVLYVLPIIGVTLFAYLYEKINKIIAHKTTFNLNQRMVHIFVPIIVFILLVFGIYYLAST